MVLLLFVPMQLLFDIGIRLLRIWSILRLPHSLPDDRKLQPIYEPNLHLLRYVPGLLLVISFVQPFPPVELHYVKHCTAGSNVFIFLI
jgi:hypothetical protein